MFLGKLQGHICTRCLRGGRASPALMVATPQPDNLTLGEAAGASLKECLRGKCHKGIEQ